MKAAASARIGVAGLLAIILTGLPLPGAIAAQQAAAPERLGDRLAVGIPASQGLDVGRLESLHGRIESGDYGAIHSLRVVRGGTLVFERYYGTSHVNGIHTLQSVTKSIAALLIGISIDDGDIPGVDVPVEQLFPEYSDIFERDPRKRRFTLHHVLTMSHGLEWDELSIPYGHPDNVVLQLAQSEDWMRFVLSRPVATEPGQAFRYSSGASLLLSGILQNATGLQAHAYAEGRLFDPLGIPVYAWYHHLDHAKRWSHTGGGLRMRSRDLGKIGLLVLGRGAWQGRQIVSASRIDRMIEPHLRISDTTAYGYQWYLRPIPPEPSARNAVAHG